jgi:hypothetical protein
MSATVPTTAPPHAPAATDGRIRFQHPELPPVGEVLAYFERSGEQQQAEDGRADRGGRRPRQPEGLTLSITIGGLSLSIAPSRSRRSKRSSLITAPASRMIASA